MKNKSLIILAVVFAVLLAGAGIAYNHFADRAPARQLGTVPAQTRPAETTAPTQAQTEAAETAATEATEPADYSAPDFTVYDFEGNEVRFSDFVGKPIVLNFWATWCGPCQSEMPTFNKVYEELGGEVTFLMVNAGEDADVVKEYIASEGFTFPVFLDTSRNATGVYGISAYPTSFFIDAQGDLITYAIGAIDEETLMIGVDMIYTPQ